MLRSRAELVLRTGRVAELVVAIWTSRPTRPQAAAARAAGKVLPAAPAGLLTASRSGDATTSSLEAAEDVRAARRTHLTAVSGLTAVGVVTGFHGRPCR